MKFSILLLTLVCLSCSVTERYLMDDGKYFVESSCSDAEQQVGTVDVSYNGVLSENSVTFNDGKKFGLPENHVGTSSGMITMEGESRTCKAPLWSKKTTKLLFLCHSNADANDTCHVYIHK